MTTDRGTVGVLSAVRRGMAKMLLHHKLSDVAKYSHSPTVGSRHSPTHREAKGLGFRWRVAIAVLVILSVHALGSNVVLPLLSHQLNPVSGQPSANLHRSYRESHGSRPSSTSLLETPSPEEIDSPADAFTAISRAAAAAAAAVAARAALDGDEGDWSSEEGSYDGALGGNLSAAAAGRGGGRSWRALPGSLGDMQPAGGPLPPSEVARWQCGEGSTASLATAALPFAFETRESKKYVKHEGKYVAPARWCRGDFPWLSPQLRQVVLLESSKPRPLQGITIVTQLTLERLGQLQNQCRMWPYQVAASVYVPQVLGRTFSPDNSLLNGTSLDVAIAQVLRFHASQEAKDNACILDLELVTEETCSLEQANFYPANAMRNRSLRLARTKMVLLLDPDFVASHSLARLADSKEEYSQMLHRLKQKTAVVVPAFQTAEKGPDGKALAAAAVEQGKDFVVQQLREHNMTAFALEPYPMAHKGTEEWEWARGHDWQNVTYKTGYNPYLLMATKYTPWFDERFRGYYWNSASHRMHIALQLQYTFTVHPSAFVVYVPQTPSTRALSTLWGERESEQKGFKSALAEIRRGKFVPVTCFPEDCLEHMKKKKKKKKKMARSV